MRTTPLLVLTVLLGACASGPQGAVSHRQIVRLSGQEVARRENWNEQPSITARQVTVDGTSVWTVRADVIDRRLEAGCNCGRIKPGFSRLLVFSQAGELLKYEQF